MITRWHYRISMDRAVDNALTLLRSDVIHGSEYGNWSLLYFFAIFISLWGFPMTLLSSGALTDPRLLAAASKVCTTDAWLGGLNRSLHVCIY